jgi:hypothetical protein
VEYRCIAVQARRRGTAVYWSIVLKEYYRDLFVVYVYKCSTRLQWSRSSTGIQMYRSSTAGTGVRSSTGVQWVQEKHRCTGVLQWYKDTGMLQVFKCNTGIHV